MLAGQHPLGVLPVVQELPLPGPVLHPLHPHQWGLHQVGWSVENEIHDFLILLLE